MRGSVFSASERSKLTLGEVESVYGTLQSSVPKGEIVSVPQETSGRKLCEYNEKHAFVALRKGCASLTSEIVTGSQVERMQSKMPEWDLLRVASVDTGRREISTVRAETLEPAESFSESAFASPTIQGLYCGQLLQLSRSGDMISGEAIPNVRQELMLPDGLSIAVSSIPSKMSVRHLNGLCGRYHTAQPPLSRL